MAQRWRCTNPDPDNCHCRDHSLLRLKAELKQVADINARFDEFTIVHDNLKKKLLAAHPQPPAYSSVLPRPYLDPYMKDPYVKTEPMKKPMKRMEVKNPLYGWRKWRYTDPKPSMGIEVTEEGVMQTVRRGNRKLLAPIHHSGHMPYVKGSFVAQCTYADIYTKGQHGYHTVPGASCTCGIYAFHTLASFLGTYTVKEDEVITLIRAYGNIEVHIEGFRTEKAEVVALLVPGGYRRRRRFFKPLEATDVMTELAEYYGAELVPYNGTSDAALHRNPGIAFKAAEKAALPNVRSIPTLEQVKESV